MMNGSLKTIIIKYLKDAGFDDSSYVVDESGSDYVEIFFTNNDAVFYIMTDIKKTDFYNYVEILDYKYKTGIISAIITYREE